MSSEGLVESCPDGDENCPRQTQLEKRVSGVRGQTTTGRRRKVSRGRMTKANERALFKYIAGLIVNNEVKEFTDFERIRGRYLGIKPETPTPFWLEMVYLEEEDIRTVYLMRKVETTVSWPRVEEKDKNEEDEEEGEDDTFTAVRYDTIPVLFVKREQYPGVVGTQIRIKTLSEGEFYAWKVGDPISRKFLSSIEERNFIRRFYKYIYEWATEASPEVDEKGNEVNPYASNRKPFTRPELLDFTVNADAVIKAIDDYYQIEASLIKDIERERAREREERRVREEKEEREREEREEKERKQREKEEARKEREADQRRKREEKLRKKIERAEEQKQKEEAKRLKEQAKRERQEQLEVKRREKRVKAEMYAKKREEANERKIEEAERKLKEAERRRERYLEEIAVRSNFTEGGPITKEQLNELTSLVTQELFLWAPWFKGEKDSNKYEFGDTERTKDNVLVVERIIPTSGKGIHYIVSFRRPPYQVDPLSDPSPTLEKVVVLRFTKRTQRLSLLPVDYFNPVYSVHQLIVTNISVDLNLTVQGERLFPVLKVVNDTWGWMSGLGSDAELLPEEISIDQRPSFVKLPSEAGSQPQERRKRYGLRPRGTARSSEQSIGKPMCEFCNREPATVQAPNPEDTCTKTKYCSQRCCTHHYEDVSMF